MRAVPLALLGCSVCLAACGQDLTLSSGTSGSGSTEHAVVDGNGMDRNGLGQNGMDRNGMDRNGMDRNGMDRNGLGTAAFVSWFNDPAYVFQADVMKYLVGCALASGTSVNWTNPVTGTAYSWKGVFGLAPGWATRAPTVLEQQAVSGCLMAHVNTKRQHVWISLRGSGIGYSSYELNNFETQEGVFFGNLFGDKPVRIACFSKEYRGTVQPSLHPGRECTLNTNCYNVIAGDCASVCGLSSTGVGGALSCTYGGQTFTRPITAYLEEE